MEHTAALQETLHQDMHGRIKQTDDVPPVKGGEAAGDEDRHQPLYLKTNMSGGHGGSSGRYDQLRETAFRYAFMLDAVGLASGESRETPAE
jgi:protease II